MAKKISNKENTNKPLVTESEGNTKIMPFGKTNYIIVLIGIAFILLGMILMIGGGSDNPDVFNPKMFDFQHITLAPILVLIGFVVEIVAIFWRTKTPKS